MNGNPRRAARPGLAARQRAEAGNQAAATLIFADVEKHGGEGSLMVRWARAVIRANDATPLELMVPRGPE